MPNDCVAYGCTNHGKIDGITYHSFPKNDVLRQQWTNAIKRKNWVPNKWSKLCSAHFRESDINRTTPHYIQIREGAVPDIFPAISHTKERRKLKRVDRGLTAYIVESENQALKKELDTSQKGLKLCQKKVKRILQSKRRLEKKVAKLDDIIRALQEKINLGDESCSLLTSISKTSECLVKRTALKVENNATRKLYDERLKAFAITLHFLSPKAYVFVRKTFNTALPHPRTLRAWYSSVNANPGFCEESLRALKEHCTNAKYQTICSLMLDSMAIRKHLEWDGHKLHGPINVGISTDDDSAPLATEALVFHLVSINSSWKIPVGYFFVNGVNGEQLSGLAKQCISLLHDCGVKIASLTCDGTATNIAMANNLGCSISPEHLVSWFPHPITNTPVNFFLDPPHMLKLVRNTLGDHGVLTDVDSNKIEWKYIEQLHSLQKELELRLGNKLTNSHVYYKKQKMKVTLAAQVLSASVADSLEHLLLKEVEGFEECSATISFLRRFNKLFDILNSRSIYANYDKKALCPSNFTHHSAFLEETKMYILGLKDKQGIPILKSKRKTGFLGLVTCIQSTITMYKQLVEDENCPLRYLPLYKVSQDHIERLFGYIRSRGGHNNNPSCKEFTGSMKRILLHKELEESNSGNSLVLNKTVILSFQRNKSEIQEINISTPTWRIQEDQEQSHLGDEEVYDDAVVHFGNRTDIGYDIVEYIAGFVRKRLSSKIICEECQQLLGSNTICHGSLISCKNRGGLVQPSEGLIRLCNMCESVIRSHINTTNRITKKINLVEEMTLRVIRSSIDKSLFPGNHYLEQKPDRNHFYLLAKAICKQYFSVRLHFVAKNFNDSLHKNKIRKSLHKIITFTGQ